MKIDPSQLGAVPYLKTDVVGDRIINLLPLWEGGEWQSWLPSPDGKLIAIKMVDAVHSDYLAQEPARADDLLIPFIEFLWKHASWPDVAGRIHALAEDVHNLAASLAKIDHFFQQREAIGDGVCRFVETEMEYVFVVCRSLFDLLQEIVATLWERVQLLDPDLQNAKKQLPKSFRRMVLHDGNLMTPEDIETKHRIPPPLAEFYAETAPFFSELRRHRDRVVHGIGKQQSVFNTERGFGVSPDAEPFASLVDWADADYYNKNVACLRTVLAQAIFGSVYACNAFTTVVASCLRFPPDLAPGYRLFIRS